MGKHPQNAFKTCLATVPDRFSHFFHSTNVPVKTVTTRPNWNIEFDQIVCIIWVGFSYIPLYLYKGQGKALIFSKHYLYTRSTKHYTRIAILHCHIVWHDTNIHISFSPNSILRQKLFYFIQTRRILTKF